MNAPTALAEWRAKHGKTQRQLAEALGVSQASVTDWEAGKKLPRVQSATAIERLTEGAVKASTWGETDAAPSPDDATPPEAPVAVEEAS